MIEFDNKLIAEAVDDIDDVADNVDELIDRHGRYSVYQQIEKTVDEEVTSPILSKARRYGREYVGDRVSTIRAVDGRWEGNRYRTGITSDNEVVLAHEYGSGEYGRGNGEYRIEPGEGKKALSFEFNGRPIAVNYVVHPGVRGRRFMRRAVREQTDQLARDLEDDVQSTLQDALSSGR